MNSELDLMNCHPVSLKLLKISSSVNSVKVRYIECNKGNMFFKREIGCSLDCVYQYCHPGFGGQLNCFARRTFCTFYKVIEIFFKHYLLSSSKLTFTRWFFTKREISFIFNVFVGESERRLPI